MRATSARERRNRRPYSFPLLRNLSFSLGLLVLAAGCGPAPRETKDSRLVPVGSVGRLAPATTTLEANTWPAIPPAGSWPQFQRDGGRTGASTLDFPSADFRLVWRFDLGEHTFRYRRGTNLWTESATACEMKGQLRIVLGAYDHKVYCLDGMTGKRLWRYTTGDEVAATPVLAPPRAPATIVIASTDRVLYGLDPAKGLKRWAHEVLPWSYTVSPAEVASPALFQLQGKDLVAAGYFVNDKGRGKRIQEGYAALWEAHTGKVRWKLNLAKTRVYGPAAGVVLGRPILFFITAEGLVTAVDARSGQVAWARTSDERVRACPTFVGNDERGTVFVATHWGMLWALDGATGKPRWRYRASHMVEGSPAVASLGEGRKAVFFGAHDRCLHAVDFATGKRLWRFSTRGVVLASPATARVGGKTAVFFSSMDNILYCLDGATGKKLWSFPFGQLPWPFVRRGDAVFGSPLVTKGSRGPLLVFPAHDGKVYAFQAKG